MLQAQNRQIPMEDARDQELVRSAGRHSPRALRELSDIRDAPRITLNWPRAGTKTPASRNMPIEEGMPRTDGREEQSLARDMIEVHGAEAATVARDNARAAARRGQARQAKSWIRVLGIIQRQRSGKASTK